MRLWLKEQPPQYLDLSLNPPRGVNEALAERMLCYWPAPSSQYSALSLMFLELHSEDRCYLLGGESNSGFIPILKLSLLLARDMLT